jgi:hypothetical protein
MTNAVSNLDKVEDLVGAGWGRQETSSSEVSEETVGRRELNAWMDWLKEYYFESYCNYYSDDEDCEDDDPVVSYNLVTLAIEFDMTSEQECELFESLTPITVANVEIIEFKSFCHKYNQPQETFWVLGNEGQNCLEVCTSMDMVTDSFQAPDNKRMFQETTVAYTAGNSQESDRTISDICRKVSNIKHWDAPAINEYGTCFWDTRNLEPDAFSMQYPAKTTRRFCPCVGLSSRRRKLNVMGKTTQDNDMGTPVQAKNPPKTNEGWRGSFALVVVLVLVVASLTTSCYLKQSSIEASQPLQIL